jgi:hypothetical protein
LLLDPVDGGDTGCDAGLPLLGQGYQLGPPVGRARPADDVPQLLALLVALRRDIH